MLQQVSFTFSIHTCTALLHLYCSHLIRRCIALQVPWLHLQGTMQEQDVPMLSCKVKGVRKILIQSYLSGPIKGRQISISLALVLSSSRECDPDLCKSCCATCEGTAAPGTECLNMRLRMRQHMRIMMGKSTVQGDWRVWVCWGLLPGAIGFKALVVGVYSKGFGNTRTF